MCNDRLISPREIRQFMDRKLSPVLLEVGLTPSNGPFVLEISNNEGISQSELSYNLNVDKALTTRAIRHLIENGFVEDRSSYLHKYSLYLTDKGKEAAKVAEKTVNDTWGQIFSILEEEEAAEFKRILEKIGKVIKDDLKKGDEQ